MELCSLLLYFAKKLIITVDALNAIADPIVAASVNNATLRGNLLI